MCVYVIDAVCLLLTRDFGCDAIFENDIKDDYRTLWSYDGVGSMKQAAAALIGHWIGMGLSYVRLDKYAALVGSGCCVLSHGLGVYLQVVAVNSSALAFHLFYVLEEIAIGLRWEILCGSLVVLRAMNIVIMSVGGCRGGAGNGICTDGISNDFVWVL